MKKITALLLMLCMVFALGACGGSGDNNTENNSQQESQADSNKESESTEGSEDDGMIHYTVKVTDEAGNPIANVMVQLCSENCFPGKTNEEGVAEIARPEDTYKVSVVAMPEGYDYVDAATTEFYYEDGATEITIVLKAVQ